MEILVSDIETDDIKATKIWMVGVLDWRTDVFTSYDVEQDNVAEGLFRLQEAALTIGHNWRGYDVKSIERLTEGVVRFDQRRLIDTLDLSRRLVKLENHKLKTWGELFDFPKGDHTDFSRFSPEMRIYCEQDCRLAKRIFDFLNELHMERGGEDLLKGFR